MDTENLYYIVRMQAIFTALPLGFGLLHLILYAYLREQRSNLFYAVFLITFGAAIYFDFEASYLREGTVSVVMLQLHRLSFSICLIFGLRFFYELFLHVLPRRFWIGAGITAVAGALAVVAPNELFWPVEVLAVVILGEILRVTVAAARRGRADAWIVAAGFGVFLLFVSYDLMMDFGMIDPVADLVNGYQFGSVGLFVSTSIYLARDVARTQNRLMDEQRRAQENEMEMRLLKADVAWKTKELEDARKLQLSMLPERFPDLPGLAIAADMETASEVGRDYYDVRTGANGDVTVVVGDATGHGLKAGIMVAITKSLFRSGPAIDDIPAFFNRSTRILKQMRLGNLFMAMTVMLYRDRTLTLSAAGLPPLLLYRAATDQIEEIRLTGMPLGAFVDFPYQQRSVELGAGDTVLAMTDGFLELADTGGVMLDLPRAREAFAEAASSSPAEIISHLKSVASDWRGKASPTDDMTFLVVKVR